MGVLKQLHNLPGCLIDPVEKSAQVLYSEYNFAHPMFRKRGCEEHVWSIQNLLRCHLLNHLERNYSNWEFQIDILFGCISS